MSRPVKDGRRKITKRGIIAPNLLEKHTYNPLEGARTEEEIYELTFQDAEEMSSGLVGKPILSQHKSSKIGELKRNWVEGNKWMVEFELDGSLGIMAEQTVLNVEAGILNKLSLSHRPDGNEPVEVSLVWEPARVGSVLTAAKNGENYKESATGSSSVVNEDKCPVFKLPRNFLVQAAIPSPSMSSASSVLAYAMDTTSSVNGNSDRKLVLSTVDAGSQARLDQAQQMIAHDKKAAEDAEIARKQVEREQNGRFKSPQQQAPGSGSGTQQQQQQVPGLMNLGNQTLTGFPNAQQQMAQQINQQTGGPVLMDTTDSLSMPNPSAQVQHQVNQYTVPSFLPVNASANPGASAPPATAPGQAAPPGASQAGAPLMQQGPAGAPGANPGAGAGPIPNALRTGNVELDKMLNDQSIPMPVRESMLKFNLDKEQQQAMLRQQLAYAGQQVNEFKTKADVSEKALHKAREDFLVSDLAFKEMMVTGWNEQSKKARVDEVMSGRLDQHITGPSGKMEMEGYNNAVATLKAAKGQSQQFSQEAQNRAAMIRQFQEQGSNGIAYSFTGSQTYVPFQQQQSSYGSGSGSGSGSMQIDQRQQSPALQANLGGGFDFKQLYNQQQQQQQQQVSSGYTPQSNPAWGQGTAQLPAYGYTTPAQQQAHLFHAPTDPLEAARPAATGGRGYSSGSDREKFQNPQDVPWNTNVYLHYEAKIIDQTNARKLLNASAQRPSDHPLVVSAAKGGIGARPTVAPVFVKAGKDDGWTPGLGPDYFSEKTLLHIFGDGSEVRMDFELYPDPEFIKPGMVKASAGGDGGPGVGIKRARNS